MHFCRRLGIILFFIVLSQLCYSQNILFRYPTTLGVYFTEHQFKKYQPISNSWEPGFGLLFTKGLNAHLDGQVNAGGYYAAESDHLDSSSALLFQLSTGIRWRPMAKARLIQPFLGMQLGVLTGNGSPRMIGTGTGGIELHYKNAYLSLQAGYQSATFTNQKGHLLYSATLSGVLRSKKSKALPFMATEAAIIPIARTLPDSDGDGVLDSLDACPYVAGLLELKGCPKAVQIKFIDSDGDGVEDKDDHCPYLVGTMEGNGCPLKSVELLDLQLARFGKKIYFKSGSSKLLNESYFALDSILFILIHNPAIKLRIDGHTDNLGKPNKNLVLSQQRTNTIINYLMTNGITKERLFGFGFGDSRPISNNYSDKGRSMNRRVEIYIDNFNIDR
jgi:outer membrane protein OmpA-like peptidoglycan-associated protein